MRRWATPFLIVGAIVGAIMLYGGRSTPTAVAGSAPSTVTVIYEVAGTARTADVTYETPSGVGQQTGVDVPMTRETDGTPGIHYAFPAGAFIYISAQNGGSGDITCRITVDGVVVSENTASGDYAIATCKGSA